MYLSMPKTIWFINDYAGSRYHGMEFRNYYFAKEFVKLGYKVYIITASYMHLFKKLPNTYGNYTFEEIDGINYVWVKVPKYGKSTDKKRVLKWFVFTAKLFFLPLSKMKKPDVVIASPMAPFLVLPAYKIAKKYNAKFIYEVKDIWPLSIIELGNISPLNPLIKAMSWCERFAIKKADEVVSSLQNYGEHIKNDLYIDKDFTWVCNGIDLEEMKNIEPLDKEIEKKIPKDKFIVGYTGTIGIANSLDTLCQAAKLLQENKDILFVIVGDGKEKKYLVKTYGKLDNIMFLKSIPKKQVQNILSFFDICYIGWKKRKIYNYGISANKIFDYMYSKKPILHSFCGKGDIIDFAKCGLSVEAENPLSIKKGILKFYEMDKKSRELLGQNANKIVINYFSYKVLSKKYEKLF